DRVEYWCRVMLDREGPKYFQEQALVALLVAGGPYAVLPPDDYVLRPERDEALAPRAVLHHYVLDAQPYYFLHAWRRVAAAAGSAHDVSA
ncbi:MAG: hypothetical protein R3362_06760, partial [Rhodothermales bacterium]|nr:hypothetical protein [Rhodothermales bacterium]